MTRRKAAVVRKIAPDPVFENVVLAKLINYIMLDGKKGVAENIAYSALDLVVRSAWNDKDLEEQSITDKNSAKDKKNVGKKTNTKKSSAKVMPGSVREDGKARKIAEKVFERAIENIKPQVEVCSHRVGGAAYQIPKAVRSKRRLDLALRWVVQFSRGSRKRYKSMAESLAREIFDAYKGRGNAIKKRDEMHKMAKSNQTFEHYS